MNPLTFVVLLSYSILFPFLALICICFPLLKSHMYFCTPDGRSDDFPLPVCIDEEFLLISSLSYPNFFFFEPQFENWVLLGHLK